jgi:Family of unknown function (DUF5947)
VTASALERVIRRAAARQQPASTGADDGRATHGSARTAAVQRCQLCLAPVTDRHAHLLDTDAGELLCACHACTILFNRRQASRGHYRLVPSRRVRLSGLSPRTLGVPVGLAFFVRRADNQVTAHYPSPAGATRWEIDPGAWERARAACSALMDIEPDVEAVLVHSTRGRNETWLVPIDECYRLVAIVRQHWQGMSGGDRVWKEIDAFFAALQEGEATGQRLTAHSG